MISFENACSIAYDYYKNRFGLTGIYKPFDVGDGWVFNGGAEGSGLVGVGKVLVSKKDGSLSAFVIPSDKNFELLRNGKELQVPREFLD